MVGAFIVFRPSFESNPFPRLGGPFFVGRDLRAVAYTFLSFFKGKVDGLTVMMHFPPSAPLLLSPSC